MGYYDSNTEKQKRMKTTLSLVWWHKENSEKEHKEIDIKLVEWRRTIFGIVLKNFAILYRIINEQTIHIYVGYYY